MRIKHARYWVGSLILMMGVAAVTMLVGNSLWDRTQREKPVLAALPRGKGPAQAQGDRTQREKPVLAAPRAIDSKEAVQIAEQFVRKNGYTDFVPTDLAALQPEGIEYGDRSQWLAMRVQHLAADGSGRSKGRIVRRQGLDRRLRVHQADERPEYRTVQ